MDIDTLSEMCERELNEQPIAAAGGRAGAGPGEKERSDGRRENARTTRERDPANQYARLAWRIPSIFHVSVGSVRRASCNGLNVVDVMTSHG